MTERMHRILVIGVGSIGERHVRCMQRTGRAIVGICEPKESLRQKVAARYAVRDVFADVDDALKQHWDAAVIATPAPLHISLGLKLAHQGIHLLIEKPLAVSIDEVGTLMQVVAERELIAGVAYVYRAHPGLEAMRKLIIDHRFGRPVQLVVTCGQNFPFYRPAYRQTYYRDRAQGGGAIQDALTHLLNAGEWLCGPITRLAADASHQVLDGTTVEDTVHLICRHNDYLLGSYALNQHQPPNELSISVICEGGIVRWEMHHNRCRWMTQPDGTWHDEPIAPMQRDDWFTRQENFFLDAVEGRRPLLCTLAEGLQTLRVNLAALASADSGGGMEPVGGDAMPAGHGSRPEAECVQHVLVP